MGIYELYQNQGAEIWQLRSTLLSKSRKKSHIDGLLQIVTIVTKACGSQVFFCNIGTFPTLNWRNPAATYVTPMYDIFWLHNFLAST